MAATSLALVVTTTTMELEMQAPVGTTGLLSNESLQIKAASILSEILNEKQSSRSIPATEYAPLGGF